MPPKGEDALKRPRGERLTLAKMPEAAEKLGGECLSTEYKSLRTRMRWRCAKGHVWESQGQNVRGNCLRYRTEPARDFPSRTLLPIQPLSTTSAIERSRGSMMTI